MRTMAAMPVGVRKKERDPPVADPEGSCASAREGGAWAATRAAAAAARVRLPEAFVLPGPAAAAEQGGAPNVSAVMRARTLATPRTHAMELALTGLNLLRHPEGGDLSNG